VTYGNETWTVRKKERKIKLNTRKSNIPDSDIWKRDLDSAEKGKENKIEYQKT
jgi:hypothetical protein